MEFPTQILSVYSYYLLFAWVLTEQLGFPLPAAPVLMAAGALSARHELNFAGALIAGLAASLIADTTWFHIGRHYGHGLLRILCKLSLEPTICVRQTQNSFGLRGRMTLLIAKFIPGLATLASPVAGQNGMSYGSFLLFDGTGALLWLLTMLLAGRFFGAILQRNAGLIQWVGRFSGALLLLGIAGFFIWRLIRRRMYVHQLAAARLEPEQLKKLLDAGQPVYIVDLRHPLELLPTPYTLPGALHISPDALAARHMEIPRDRDVVLYCTCPSEATAAKTAMTLHKLGIDRVRPLRGGLDQWMRLGYPLDAIPPAQPVVATITAG